MQQHQQEQQQGSSSTTFDLVLPSTNVKYSIEKSMVKVEEVVETLHGKYNI